MMLGNVVLQSLMNNGAFEMYVNNNLVFSKLKEGRYPTEEVYVKGHSEL